MNDSDLYPRMTAELRASVLERDCYQCQYCGAMPPDATLHIDHIIPFVKDGPTIMANLCVACTACNGSKSDKDVLEWIKTKNLAAIKKPTDEEVEIARTHTHLEAFAKGRVPKTRRTGFSLEIELLSLLDKHCEAYRIPRSSLVTILLRRFFGLIPDDIWKSVFRNFPKSRDTNKEE